MAVVNGGEALLTVIATFAVAFSRQAGTTPRKGLVDSLSRPIGTRSTPVNYHDESAPWFKWSFDGDSKKDNDAENHRPNALSDILKVGLEWKNWVEGAG